MAGKSSGESGWSVKSRRKLVRHRAVLQGHAEPALWSQAGESLSPQRL